MIKSSLTYALVLEIKRNIQIILDIQTEYFQHMLTGFDIDTRHPRRTNVLLEFCASRVAAFQSTTSAKPPQRKRVSPHQDVWFPFPEQPITKQMLI